MSQGTISSSHSDYERTMTRRVLLKLDCRVLPPIALIWLASWIDRTNIGNARIAGLEKDTGLQHNQFNTILAVFYVTYIIVDLPSNWVMKRMKPDRWLSILVGTWGIVTTLTCLVQNFAGLILIRLFLGLCEAGLLPGIVLYLSTLYKRHELQLRVGIFYASVSLSGAFGGLLASAIIKMDGVGGLTGWRWIFILEGIVTVLFSFVSWYFLPSNLASASFLTEEEREFAIRRFRADHAITSFVPVSTSPTLNVEKQSEERINSPTDKSTIENMNQEEEKFEWLEIKRGLLDTQAWLTGLAYFALVIPLYSYSLFLPTIVRGLGYEGINAQLHTVPPYVPAAVLTVVVAVLSDRLKWRGPFVLICIPLAIAGYILAVTVETNTGRYAAVFLVASGIYPCGPCMLSILPNNSSGHYKKATTTALQIMVGNCGAFLATFAYTEDQAPKYIKGHSISLAFLCLAWLLVGANVAYCKWENKARAEGRRQSNLTDYEELWNSGKSRAPIGDRHPEFRFTL